MSLIGSIFRDIVQLRADMKAAASRPEITAPRIFIGYDSRQPVAYNVLQHSIIRRATRPVSIRPLVLDTLPITRQGLTPFTFSRFLVPWLCDFDGWALFLDLDMLVLDDITQVFDCADSRYAVMVTRSNERFEWASSMLFNCAHPENRRLTPDYVEDSRRCESPHVFDWLGESLIGDLPSEWNHTVGYDAKRNDAKLVHFTQGIPCHAETGECEYANEWRQELENLGTTRPWLELMGHSVHATQLADGRVVPKLFADHGKPGDNDPGAS